MRIIVTAVLLFVFCAGCSDPKIDATSPENIQASVEKINDKLTPDERELFTDALGVVTLNSLGNNLFEMAANTDNFEKLAYQAIDGKTADEIIAMAEDIQVQHEAEAKRRTAREREQALEEIQELQQKAQKAKRDEAELAKFTVSKSRFYFTKDYFGDNEPKIELVIQNNTQHPVSRAYFEGTLASPGRTIPWHKDTFNYAIPGGLEPGEKAEWTLAPNRFSDWGKVELKPDMIFTVEVIRLDGPDNIKLFDSQMTQYDEQRLKSLLEEYGNLQ